MRRWVSTKQVVSLSAVGATAMVLAFVGCGSSDEQLTCGEDGCMICDGFGCRPATPEKGGTGGAPSTDSGTGGVEVDSGGTCDPTVSACPCGPDDTCADGTVCIDGLCLVACEFSSQCGDGRICVNGKCVVGCDLQNPCPEGFTCDAKGACQPDTECGPTQPCTGGLTCVDGECRGGCTTHQQCAPNEICDAATNTCILDPQPKAPCEGDPSVCNSQQQCVEGYCQYPCPTPPQSCELIDARIPVCSEGICRTETEANPECIKKEDCAPGQDCVSNVCL